MRQRANSRTSRLRASRRQRAGMHTPRGRVAASHQKFRLARPPCKPGERGGCFVPQKQAWRRRDVLPGVCPQQGKGHTAPGARTAFTRVCLCGSRAAFTGKVQPANTKETGSNGRSGSFARWAAVTLWQVFPQKANAWRREPRVSLVKAERKCRWPTPRSYIIKVVKAAWPGD